LETTTTQEVVFLAPLDHVSARGRAKEVFGFDYVWEVYKPEHQRRFGYYTLPMVWGDRLVARFDSKLDRTTNTFVILGLWLEDEALGTDEAFAEALAGGLARFVRFLGASKLDATAIREPRLAPTRLRFTGSAFQRRVMARDRPCVPLHRAGSAPSRGTMPQPTLYHAVA